jgi:hypothetical protein
MARPGAFDTDEALDHAAEFFRANGSRARPSRTSKRGWASGGEASITPSAARSGCSLLP